MNSWGVPANFLPACLLCDVFESPASTGVAGTICRGGLGIRRGIGGLRGCLNIRRRPGWCGRRRKPVLVKLLVSFGIINLVVWLGNTRLQHIGRRLKRAVHRHIARAYAWGIRLTGRRSRLDLSCARRGRRRHGWLRGDRLLPCVRIE